jgi:hypothetical protein
MRVNSHFLVELPQLLGIAQAVNLAKPIDIAELANSTNCKRVNQIVNADNARVKLIPFSLILLCGSMPER